MEVEETIKNWGTAANWVGDAVPGDNADIVFSGTAPTNTGKQFIGHYLQINYFCIEQFLDLRQCRLAEQHGVQRNRREFRRYRLVDFGGA